MDEGIYRLNQEMTVTALPVIAFIGLLSVIGVIGNAVVIFVYYRKYPACNFKYFVLILAVIDLVSCAVLMPLEIYTLAHWFVFTHAWMCKLKSFLNVYTVTSSAATLLLIAIDRYRKVCRPHNRQIHPRLATKLTAVVLFVSLIPAGSDGVFWGTHTFVAEYEGKNITAKMCEKDDSYKDTILPTLHTLVLYGSTNLIVMISTMILYIFIAAKLFCQPSRLSVLPPQISVTTPLSLNSDSATMGHRESVFKFPDLGIESGFSESENVDDTIDLSDGDITNDADKGYSEKLEMVPIANEEVAIKVGQIDIVKQSLSIPDGIVTLRRKSLNDLGSDKSQQKDNKLRVRISLDLLDNNSESAFLQVPSLVELRRKPRPLTMPPAFPTRTCRTPSPSRHHRQVLRRRSTIAGMPGHRGMRLRRKTLIMFILTTTFVITTILYFSLIGGMADTSDFITTLNNVERTTWIFFLRLYFVNSVMNPVLYGFLDPRFRAALWGMGVRVRWMVGSLKRNLGSTITRTASGRTVDEVVASSHRS